MARDNETRKRLKDLLQSQLQADFEAEGHSLTAKVRQAAADEAETLLDELEGQVLHRRRSELKRSSFWAFLSGVAQSFVASVIFALVLAAWWFVEFGSRQAAVDLMSGKEPAKAHASVPTSAPLPSTIAGGSPVPPTAPSTPANTP